MALVRVLQAENGGTVRIFDDCVAKTQEENDRRRREIGVQMTTIAMHAVDMYGADETTKRLRESEQALERMPMPKVIYEAKTEALPCPNVRTMTYAKPVRLASLPAGS